MAPIMASVASVPLSCSDSNQRSRIGRAAPVRISTASLMAGPSWRKARPSWKSFQKSLRPGLSKLGGVIVNVGSITLATRSSMAS